MLAAAKTALSFAASHWKGVLIALAFAALGLKLLSAQGDARHWHKESDRYASLYHAEQASFRNATALAQAQDKAHAATVERDQAVISQEVSRDYQTRITDLRTRYDALRLRGKGSTTASNISGGSDPRMSEAGQSAAGADAASGQEGLPDPDALICSLQAEQLDALISWQERQEAVPR